MKLSVSNIAWEEDELEAHLALLQTLNCDGVELAPSCIWKEPLDATDSDIESLLRLLSKYELEVPALQSLLFTRQDLCIFDDADKRRETIEYFKGLIRLAGKLSAGTLIYGSPKSRSVGDKPYDECYGIAVELFRELAEEAEKSGTVFCIEPLERSMADFINTADEGYKLVSDVEHPNFGLHLDARAMHELKEDAGDVFQRYGSVMKHFHIGDPGLAPPGSTGEVDHAGMGAALIASPYDGYVSIEMRRGFGDSKVVVTDAVGFLRQNYMRKP